MRKEKHWAKVDSNNICYEQICSHNEKCEIQNDWIEFTPSEEQGSIVGLQYQNGIWADIRTYTEKRKAEYDQLNQFEMQFDDQLNGTTTWVDAINAIKQEFPK